MKYKVITVTNNVNEYPQYRKSTLEHPELVDLICDECATFVVDETNQYWPADEFFAMADNNVVEFETKD
jgi:hypothetical protein